MPYEARARQDQRCRGQAATPASQDIPAVVEGTSTSDVLLLLTTGLRYIPKWKTEE
jgi:hypothetical protein